MKKWKFQQKAYTNMTVPTLRDPIHKLFAFFYEVSNEYPQLLKYVPHPSPSLYCRILRNIIEHPKIQIYGSSDMDVIFHDVWYNVLLADRNFTESQLTSFYDTLNFCGNIMTGNNLENDTSNGVSETDEADDEESSDTDEADDDGADDEESSDTDGVSDADGVSESVTTASNQTNEDSESDSDDVEADPTWRPYVHYPSSGTKPVAELSRHW